MTVVEFKDRNVALQLTGSITSVSRTLNFELSGRNLTPKFLQESLPLFMTICYAGDAPEILDLKYLEVALHQVDVSRKFGRENPNDLDDIEKLRLLCAQPELTIVDGGWELNFTTVTQFGAVESWKLLGGFNPFSVSSVSISVRHASGFLSRGVVVR